MHCDEEVAFTLADDAATISAIVRLREVRIGDWPALDVIGHVADTADLFAMRVRRAVTEDAPVVQDEDTDRLVAERSATRDALECAKRIQAGHGEIVGLLRHPGAAGRPVTHSAMGRVNAGHLAA